MNIPVPYEDYTLYINDDELLYAYEIESVVYIALSANNSIQPLLTIDPVDSRNNPGIPATLQNIIATSLTLSALLEIITPITCRVTTDDIADMLVNVQAIKHIQSVDGKTVITFSSEQSLIVNGTTSSLTALIQATLFPFTPSHSLLRVTTIFPSIDNTRKDVNALSFLTKRNRFYAIHVNLAYNSNLTSMSCTVGVRLKTGTGNIHGKLVVGISAAAVATPLETPIRFISSDANQAGASIVGTSVSSTSVVHNVSGILFLEPLSDGEFVITFGNRTTGTATVNLLVNSNIQVFTY